MPICELVSDAPVTAFPHDRWPGLTPPSNQRRGKRRLGDVVVELGFADRNAVDRVIELARSTHRLTGEVLVEEGILTSAQLAHVLAERNGLDFVDLSVFQVDQGAANLIDATAARRYGSLPIAFVDEHTLLVATSDPANLVAADDISMRTGYAIRRAVAAPQDIEALTRQLSRLDDAIQLEEEAEEAEVIELRESADDAPVVKLVNSIMAEAVDRGASDIHYDPRGADMRVRMRVDGVVRDSTTVPRGLVAGLLSRIKIMAELDISERRLPQDGRIRLMIDGRYVDIRVATLPVVHGESIVMRVLDKSRVVMDLDRVGMERNDRERFERAIAATHGAVLVTGPTGTGKTTTLYAALGEINTPDKTVLTIEDPIEYEIEGIKQVQVNPKAGLTFANGLRAMVRADPDVLLVGEIRDRETAQIAIESALTGHLVLSTLHTNSAPVAAARLIEMGIEPFLVAAGVDCVVAQRLARRLCDCKQPVAISRAALAENGFEPDAGPIDGFKPQGCARCGLSGYRGRIGLYEVMIVDEEIRNLIVQKAPAGVLGAAARKAGMGSLREDGLEKVRRGTTSLAEMLRVIGS
jgi:type IV pilus assembly protein PilB